LILAPFKNSALNIVEKVIHLSGALQFDNKKRFLDEYGLDPEKDVIDSKKPGLLFYKCLPKDDHQKTFAGKIDDCFRLGVQFAKKNVKLYCPFYSSDLIVASPLGLRMAIESGEKNDFLSSIEMMILDSANVLLMQNWEHVEYIFQHLNQIPKNPHETDFSRVKSWYLDGNAGFVRQTLVFSSMLTPELNTLYNAHMNNVDGKLKIRSDPGNGTKSQVLQPILQTMIRIKSRDVVEANDARFKYFTERLFPDMKQDISEKKHYLLFVPNYFDYVRLRNWLTEQGVNFASLSDYTSASDISRARTEFYHEKVDMLVLTERFHFYRR
jgi:U3 small nucleolar RNA-associated protein 25